jgi:group I intron endonuclease
MGYIYKITNKITSKYYIGQTIQDLNERWRHHRSPKSNCRYLKLAIKKYGIENFNFDLICICFDNELDKYEYEYIKKYNSLVPNGYNLREGGNNSRHNEQTKNKISESLKNRTDFIRSKPQLGKPHSEEVKNKISKALIGIKQNPESIQKRSELLTKYKIFKIDKYSGEVIEIFNGYDEAAKSVGVNKAAIWNVCNGKAKTSKDFIWKSELI